VFNFGVREEVPEDDVVKFEAFGLVDRKAKRVLQDLRESLLGRLVADENDLIAAKLERLTLDARIVFIALHDLLVVALALEKKEKQLGVCVRH